MSVAARAEVAEKPHQDFNGKLVELEARMRSTKQRPEDPYPPVNQLIDPSTLATPTAADSTDIPAHGVEFQIQHSPTTSTVHVAAKKSRGLADSAGGNFTESPLFTGAEQKLAEFSDNLQPQDRQMILQQWCIQMYHNEDFKVLCRVLDESVRAQLTLPT